MKRVVALFVFVVALSCSLFSFTACYDPYLEYEDPPYVDGGGDDETEDGKGVNPPGNPEKEDSYEAN